MVVVSVTCPHCQTRYRMDETVLGKKGRCKKCGNAFVLARADGAAPRSAPAVASSAMTAPQSRQPPENAIISEDGVAGTWRPGDVILNLYEVKQVHEGGGMGLVYRVHHKGWNVDLAVKSPRPEFFRNERDKENFEREAETWVKLGLHPHTVSCYYVRRLGGIPRVFAEYVEGGTLGEAIHSGKLYEGGAGPALTRILDVAIQFAWGLKYAHEQGLVHQDVKPGNVLLTKDGTAKVTDFGLARARGTAGATPPAGAQMSILVSTGGMTPAYCSPEQAAGDKLTRKTDLWSWAASILEMFTGDVTWPSGTVAGEALEGYLEMAEGSEGMPRMPTGLVALLRRCFQREPENRPKDMLEVLPALLLLYRQSAGRDHQRPAPRAAEVLGDNLNNRAVSLLDLGKQEDAEKHWHEALRAEGHHPESTYNLGLARWRDGRTTDDALIVKLREVCASRSEEWLPFYLTAQVHLERGDAAGAVEALEQIKGSESSNEEVRAALALARESLPNSRRAVRTFEGHGSYVTSVRLSRDGKLALSGAQDNKLKLWDAADGRCLRTFEGHTDEVQAVRLSNDGRYAVSGSGQLNQPGQIKVWDVTTGKCLRTMDGHKSMIYAVDLASDNSLIFSGCFGELKVWDQTSGRCLRTMATDNLSSVYTTYLSQDKRWGLSGGSELNLWEIKTGRRLRQFDKPRGDITSLSLGADERHFLTGGSDDRLLRLWEVATGRCVRMFEGHTDSVNAVHLSEDGRLALSGSNDQTVRLWDAVTGRCLRTFEGHSSYVKSVFLSGDGRLGVSGGWDNVLRLWNLEWNATAPSMISRVVMSERAVAAKTAYDQALERASQALKTDDAVLAAQCVREARALPGYARKPEAMEEWGRLYVRLARNGLNAAWEGASWEGHTSKVSQVALSRDGRLALSSGSSDEGLKVWDVATGQCLRTFEEKAGDVSSLCISPDGRQALTGNSYGEKLRVWDVATGQCLRKVEGKDYIHTVCLSDDGRLTLTATSSELQLWEGMLERSLRTFSKSGDMRAAALSGDGRYVLAGEYDKLRLWDAASGQSLRLFEGHGFWVNSACVSADGRSAVSGSSDKLVKLWDLATGRCLQTFEGHSGGVTSVCLSADGRFALSGSEDATVKLWDARTGQCVRTFEGHRYKVTSVCMSRDSRFFLSGSEDHTIKLWMLDWSLEDSRPANWHEGARPYLEVFLTLRTPLDASGLTRQGKPVVKEKDFAELLDVLGCGNYGWLRPEGVRLELKKMAAAWQGPPALPSQPAAVESEEANEPSASSSSGAEGVAGPEQLAAFLNKAGGGDIDNFAAFLNKASKTDVHEAAKNLNVPKKGGANPMPIKKPAAAPSSKSTAVTTPTRTKEKTRPKAPPSSIPAAPKPTATINVSADGRGECRTIGEAIKKATAGARIVVHPGSYPESLVIDKPLQIVGKGERNEIIIEPLESFCLKMQTDKAWVQGLTLRSKAGGSWYAVDIAQGVLVLQDCEVSSAALACVGIHGAGTAPFIYHCTIQGGKEGGVAFYQGAKGTLEDCEVFDHQLSGVDISDGAGPVVRNCRIHGCQCGANIYDSAQGDFEECDFFANALSGMQIKKAGAPTVRRCKMRGNKQAGLLVTEAGAGVLEDCTITENGLLGVEIREGGDPILRRCRIRRNGGVAVKIHNNGKGKVEDCRLKNHLEVGALVVLIVFTLAFLAWTIYLDSDGFNGWSLVTGGVALLGGAGLLGCLIDDKPTGGAVVLPKPVPPPKPAMGGAEGLAALFNKMDDQGAQQMAALFNQMGGGKDKKK
jgi:predicted Zn finger-like uncharacterized protein